MRCGVSIHTSSHPLKTEPHREMWCSLSCYNAKNDKRHYRCDPVCFGNSGVIFVLYLCSNVTKQVKHDASEPRTTLTHTEAITHHTIRCKKRVSWTSKREENEIHVQLQAKGTRQLVARTDRAFLTWEWKEKGRESEILIWIFASPPVTATNDSWNDFCWERIAWELGRGT